MKPIEAPTSVDAWLQACEYLLQQKDSWRAYNIILEIADPITLRPEERAIVSTLENFLVKRGGLPINTIVNTIFPEQLYRRHGVEGVYERYISEMYPQIKRHPDYRWGTYAQRILSRSNADGTQFIPLNELINKIKIQMSIAGTNRATYELGTIDPLLDIPIYDPSSADRNRPNGGPCLSHISVKLTADNRVMLTGFYRSHYYIQRALGNLFGLAHLQQFIAEQTDLKVGPLVCLSSMAQLELRRRRKNAPDYERWSAGDVCDLIARCQAARTARQQLTTGGV
jgi:hypothetical protein